MNAILRNGALTLIVVLSAVAAPGCTQRALDEAPEDSSSAEIADTANIEAPASIESLPPADPNAPAPAPLADSSAMPQQVTGTGEHADYTVENGDTLMKIAFKVYGDIFKWQNIYNLNREKITNANVLTAGTVLKYEKPSIEPSPEKNGDPYMIKKGDTLGTIATDVYGKSAYWKKLWENNKTLIKDPNRIYAGFYIYYQITEEERQEAERLRGATGGQQLGDTYSPKPQPSNGGGGMDSLINTDPAAAPTQGGSNDNAEGTQGLNSLAAPVNGGRVPASR